GDGVGHDSPDGDRVGVVGGLLDGDQVPGVGGGDVGIGWEGDGGGAGGEAVLGPVDDEPVGGAAGHPEPVAAVVELDGDASEGDGGGVGAGRGDVDGGHAALPRAVSERATSPTRTTGSWS